MDEQRYAELLAGSRPGVIDTPEEHERLLTIAEALMEKGQALAAEEWKLLELLVLLIRVFEEEVEAAEEKEDEEHAPLPRPHETLRRLMQSRGWQEDALTDIFGNPYLTGEAMAGRRPISKGQAKALAKLFRVPEKLFLE
ncbi:MAG: hypothetical protein ACR2NN_26900 [Bryobacteraceae bacterium]